MNKEVIKAMKRSTKKHRARNWRKEIRRKINRFFSRLVRPYYDLKVWKYNKNVKRYAWNEEKAKQFSTTISPAKPDGSPMKMPFISLTTAMVGGSSKQRNISKEKTANSGNIIQWVCLVIK